MNGNLQFTPRALSENESVFRRFETVIEHGLDPIRGPGECGRGRGGGGGEIVLLYSWEIKANGVAVANKLCNLATWIVKWRGYFRLINFEFIVPRLGGFLIDDSSRFLAAIPN